MKDLYYIRSHSNKLDLQPFYSNGHARHFPFGEKRVNFPYKTDWLESNRQSLQNNKTMTNKNQKMFFWDSDFDAWERIPKICPGISPVHESLPSSLIQKYFFHVNWVSPCWIIITLKSSKIQKWKTYGSRKCKRQVE